MNRLNAVSKKLLSKSNIDKLRELRAKYVAYNVL